MQSADHPAAAIIVSKGIPFLNVAEAEAALVLSCIKFPVSIPAFVITVLAHLEIVLLQTG